VLLALADPGRATLPFYARNWESHVTSNLEALGSFNKQKTALKVIHNLWRHPSHGLSLHGGLVAPAAAALGQFS